MSLHWLPVPQRITFKVLLITFKALHNEAPGYIADMIESHTLVRTLRSKDNCSLKIPKTRVKYGDRAFSNAAPKLWNALPRHIKAAHLIEQFKIRLKTHLFREAYKNDDDDDDDDDDYYYYYYYFSQIDSYTYYVTCKVLYIKQRKLKKQYKAAISINVLNKSITITVYSFVGRP